MANKKNKVKFGLTNVHYAKIKDWVTDASGANLTPVYVDPVRLPGAVSISIDANGENENFYKELAGYPFVNNRGAGVSSGSFLWKYTLGSLNRRTAYDDSFTPSSRKYGGKPQKHICGLTDWLIGLKGVDNTARFD